MNEDDGAARIERRQQRIEPRVAEEVFAVAGKQGDAGELERIERIGNRIERARERWGQRAMSSAA